MSLLIADVVPDGLVFAADRNLSSRGQTVGVVAKVLKHGGLLAGYVGLAEVNGQPMDEWLRGFLEANEDKAVGHVCRALAVELERESAAVPSEERGTIVHVGGFEQGRDDRPLPVIFYVRDVEVQPDGSYRRLGRFEARDELKETGNGRPLYFGNATGDQIRA